MTVSDEAGNETSKEFTVKVVEPAKLIVEDKVLTVGDKFDPLAGIQVLDVDGTDITKNIIVNQLILMSKHHQIIVVNRLFQDK